MKRYLMNGRVINPATNQDDYLDVKLEDNRITEVGKHLIPENGAEILDVEGCYVLPGFIDLHVHLRDPGLIHKEDMESGSRAAAKGGFTTVCAMPNTLPVIDTVNRLSYVQERAKKCSGIHIEQISAVTMEQKGTELVDMKAMSEHGAIGFSEDGQSVADVALYADAMKQAAELDVLIMAHCEDKKLLRGGVLNEGVASKRFGVPGISHAVEDIIAARDIFLANDYGTRLHLCHCSTAGSVELVRMAKKMGVHVTAEVCPHHFTMTDEDITYEDANFKMNPPLRTKADVQALIQGLQDGTIDAIASDHAPHSVEEKSKGFLHSPFGIVGLETSAALSYHTLVAGGVLTPMQWVEKMSWNPSRIIRIDQERGSVEVGKLADIMIWDPKAEYPVNVNEFVSKSKNSPYAGRRVTGRVVMTICEGNIVYQDASYAVSDGV